MILQVQSFIFPQANEPDKKANLAQMVKPGDLIFTKYTAKALLPIQLDANISLLQKVAKTAKLKKDPTGEYRITHASIVVAADGDRIKVAEAMPNGKKNELRLIDLLSDHSMVLTPTETFEYHVYRMDETRAGTLPERVADIAQRLSTPASYLTTKGSDTEEPKLEHRFSYARAFLSVFKNGQKKAHGREYTKMLFEMVSEEYFAGSCTCKKTDKVFCSYFAARVYLQAELAPHIPEIKKLKGVMEGLKEIEKMPEGKARERKIGAWADRMARDHGQSIRQKVTKFAIDPKSTSPEQLLEFVKKDGLFKPVFHLVPPAQETKKNPVLAVAKKLLSPITIHLPKILAG